MGVNHRRHLRGGHQRAARDARQLRRAPARPQASGCDCTGPGSPADRGSGTSLAFYQSVLGLLVMEREGPRAALAADGGRVLVELNERPGARPTGRGGRLVLYHYAILLPDRASLGRLVRHMAEAGVRAGAGDHLVSEAFYINDPDGLGIEVYADRPHETWRRNGRELTMATDPVDVQGLLEAAGDAPWTGTPPGTVMGHVHVHVGDLERAAAFFSDGIGFDRVVWSYPGALFMGAGGYHHHVGTNTWAGPGARPSEDGDARLLGGPSSCRMRRACRTSHAAWPMGATRRRRERTAGSPRGTPGAPGSG